ncbi:hypothetical protein CBL_21386, partial [Carabus blaptoides fortunei]
GDYGSELAVSGEVVSSVVNVRQVTDVLWEIVVVLVVQEVEESVLLVMRVEESVLGEPREGESERMVQMVVPVVGGQVIEVDVGRDSEPQKSGHSTTYMFGTDS